MADEDEVIAKLNENMGEQRRELASLVRDLKGDEGRLEAARKRYSELGELLTELGSEVGEKRQKAFALKMDLEGKRLAKRRPTSPGTGTAMPPTGFDQRQYPRLPYTLHVNFGGLKAFYSGIAINISETGMLVATCAPPEVGKRFAVEFELDSERSIRAPVECVWVDHRTQADDAGYAVSEVGLQFVGLSDEDTKAVREFSAAYVRELDNA